ncbi:hypothetical protein C0992_010408 [Termitomyces sp. T32_za158]|nr:hypothetical protein C0992_010408 [Termitomyces sp. T32_za158]
MLAEGLRARFQKHSVEHYYEELMQTARLQKNRKKAGSWNAYVSMETQQMNAGEWTIESSYASLILMILAELPPGVPKKKVHHFIGDIAAQWKRLSNEEKTELTKERLTTLHDTHKMRDLASHNVPISAYHDTRNTFNSLDEEARRLHAQTGIEVLLIAVWSNKEHFNRPHIFTTSERVEMFVEMTLQENIYDISMRIEAFMLLGVQAVVRNYVEENLHLRSEILALILHELKEVTNTKISRMYYHNFDSHITAKSGVVIKNWPLKTFCAPSEISSRVELNILLNAWRSDITRFHQMTRDEFEAWETQQFNDKLTNNVDHDGGGVDSVSNPSTSTTTASPLIVPLSTASAIDSHINANNPTPTPLSANIVNTVSSGGGAVVVVTKKTWKVRKDKGVKRKKPTSPETVPDA